MIAFGREEGKVRLVKKSDCEACSTFLGARGDLASDQPHTHPVDQGSQSIPNSALQHENVHVVGVDGDSSSVGEAAEGPGYPSQFMSRLEQLLRGVFSGDHLQDDSGNSQVTDADGVTRHVGAAENGNRPDAAEAAASDEGTFLSNVLRQIMPIIYENGGGSGSNDSSSGGQTTEERNTQGSSTQGEGNGNRASSSRRQEDPPAAEQPDPKRQKRD